MKVKFDLWMYTEGETENRINSEAKFPAAELTKEKATYLFDEVIKYLEGNLEGHYIGEK